MASSCELGVVFRWGQLTPAYHANRILTAQRVQMSAKLIKFELMDAARCPFSKGLSGCLGWLTLMDQRILRNRLMIRSADVVDASVEDR